MPHYTPNQWCYQNDLVYSADRFVCRTVDPADSQLLASAPDLFCAISSIKSELEKSAPDLAYVRNCIDYAMLKLESPGYVGKTISTPVPEPRDRPRQTHTPQPERPKDDPDTEAVVSTLIALGCKSYEARALAAQFADGPAGNRIAKALQKRNTLLHI